MADDLGGTLAGLARRQGISEMLHRTASRVPGKLAIICGQTRLTFAELEAAVSRTAAALAADGLTKGDRLALLSPRPVHAVNPVLS
jgi:fatty-acyl-CoA synthase